MSNLFALDKMNASSKYSRYLEIVTWEIFCFFSERNVCSSLVGFVKEPIADAVKSRRSSSVSLSFKILFLSTTSVISNSR